MANEKSRSAKEIMVSEAQAQIFFKGGGAKLVEKVAKFVGNL